MLICGPIKCLEKLIIMRNMFFECAVSMCICMLDVIIGVIVIEIFIRSIIYYSVPDFMIYEIIIIF